ncbi:MAG: protocadherin, partial [Pirellulaceae bacterium]|nr:protocadherin [Pirellulaceae bacterium]
AGRAVGGARATDGVNTVGRAGSVGAVRGPGGNTYGRARGATTYNGIVTGAGQVNAVRGNWRGYGWYGSPNWYAKYPNAWRAAAITTTAWFVGSTWANVRSYYPYNDPISYDYGEEIRYEDNNVYSGDEEIATAEEYYQQAAEIADVSDANSKDEDWMPLGVFAIVTEGQEKSDKTLQLAINRDGVVRGNYSDGLSEDLKQVEGGLDEETQRVAITFVDNRNVVAEMGLYNLTEDVLTMLVHKGPDQTEQRGLIRLQDENSDSK